MKLQKIKEIDIQDLVLWTENPRDPLDKKASDQDVVDKAIKTWKLDKLAKAMGSRYDFSELPTVVYMKQKPVVYDGNRRIAIGKINHGLVNVDNPEKYHIEDFPEEIPCNICTKKVALEHVYRKHASTGSWGQIERDYFLHKHKGEPKSDFIIFDDATELIRNNKLMNKGFVKDEVLTKTNLGKVGFEISNGNLMSKHTEPENVKVLQAIANVINTKEITTRRNRGDLYGAITLNQEVAQIIEKNKRKRPSNVVHPKPVKTRRRKQEVESIFGKNLTLAPGETNDLYRDICDLYKFYKRNKDVSPSFVAIIRMSLRLLCDTAYKEIHEAQPKNRQVMQFFQSCFDGAKDCLTPDQKTTLSTQNIKKDNIPKLLHVGAHSYSASQNEAQTLALSIIIGEIIEMKLGKNQQ